MESPATELIRMAHSLLNLEMHHLTRSEIIKQDTISLSDGSSIVYNIDITIQTEQEHSNAYKSIRELKNLSIIEPIEQLLVHLLCDPICKEDAEDDPDNMLTADDFPECAE